MFDVTVGGSLWISQAVLLFHYLVYVPIMMADPVCTTHAIWGSIGTAGQIAASVSAASAYAVHLALLWATRSRTEKGLWLASLAFYILQTAFLVFLHRGNCYGSALYKVLTRALLGACAALIVWYAWTLWRVSKGMGNAALLRAGAAFVAFHVVVMDFVYFGFWGVL
jgi:hypothetical protein